MKQTEKLPILILTALAFLLCGCDTVNDLVSRALWKFSDVESDESYRTYAELRDNGELDDDGLYHSEELAALEAAAKEPDGTIHVSFSVNDALGFTYYRDAAMTEALDTNSCWLNPGDAVYASAPDLSNAPALYNFSHFEIRARASEEEAWTGVGTSESIPGLVYAIPNDFNGTDLSILPMGYYEQRTLTLSVRDGDEELTKGFWTVNGKDYGNVTVKVNAQSTCRVVYNYGAYKDSYYFYDSDPECFYDKSSDGTVTFYETPSDKAEVSYTVEMHPYTSLLIQNGASDDKNWFESLWSFLTDADRSVYELENVVTLLEVNGSPAVNKLTGEECRLEKLKAGDEVRVRVPLNMKLTGTGVAISKPTVVSGSREYILTIPYELDENRRAAVTPRNSEDGEYHAPTVKDGTLRLYDKFGNEYLDGSELPGENETVAVEITPDEGMCVYGKHVKNNVYREEMTYSAFVTRFPELTREAEIRPAHAVVLDTTDELGSCTFWIGSEAVEGPVLLRDDDNFELDYTLNNTRYEIIYEYGDPVPMDGSSIFSVTRDIEINDSLDGRTLRCRDFVKLAERTTSNVN